jgi:hypothetical protein
MFELRASACVICDNMQRCTCLKYCRVFQEAFLKTDKKLNFIITNLLTPWSRVLREKLTGSQLVKKFLKIYGTRRFITAFTRVLNPFLF